MTLDEPLPAPTPKTVRLWTLMKGGRIATCDVQAHALGVEVMATVDDEIMRTEVAPTPDAAQQVADQWQQAFAAKGWQP